MPSNGKDADHELGIRIWDCRHKLLPFAIKLTGSADEGEELVATTIERGWRYRDKFDPTTNLVAWLFTIMRNYHLSAMRRKRWDGGHVEDYENLVVSTKGNQEDWVTLKDLEESMLLIPPQMSEAIMSIVLEGSYEEAAEALGVRIGTIKSRVARGRQMLEDLGL